MAGANPFWQSGENPLSQPIETENSILKLCVFP